MEIGVTLRNMGPQSAPRIMLDGAQRAEALGFESIWITDHIAIPPDDAEGSGGRYTDPLTTLAWLGGQTEHIRLATGVLILPYRPALPTLKQIATVQELTGGRLIMGVAVGWMDAEFRALGVPRRQRGKLTDEALTLWADCFGNPVVEQHGQQFIFSPRPAAPPVYIGGRAPHALKRAVKFGHGWVPMAAEPAALEEGIRQFEKLAAAQKTTRGPVTAMSTLPLADPDKAVSLLGEYRALGVDRVVCGLRYQDASEYAERLEQLAGIRSRLGE